MKNKNNSNVKKKKIYDFVLKKITPKKDDIKQEEEIVKTIKYKIEKLEGNHSHVEWCGSSARNTHLKGDRDIDLFVMFDEKMNTDDLEKEGLRIGKNVFRGHAWEKAYSQHPYIRGNINGFDIEIVPSYIVKSANKRKSAVDRTPFHNKFIIKNLKENQKKDVRLLKQFLKGIGAYGADLKNCSLPGYGVELLILHYKNFERFLRSASKWELKKTIKFNDKITNVEFDNPLIIVDPVDENRNVASALSSEQFQRIIFASKLFLKNPDTKFFFPKKIKTWNKNKVKKMFLKKEIIAIHSKFPKNDLSDIVWGQLRRFLKKISNHLKEKDFLVTRETLWSDEEDVYFIIELENLNLQESKKIVGPKSIDIENVEKFLKNKKDLISGPRVENDRIIIEIKRDETNAINIIEKFINDNKKKERKAVKKLLKQAVILDEKNILKKYKGKFSEFFTKYLEGKESFE